MQPPVCCQRQISTLCCSSQIKPAMFIQIFKHFQAYQAKLQRENVWMNVSRFFIPVSQCQRFFPCLCPHKRCPTLQTNMAKQEGKEFEVAQCVT